MLYYQHLYYPKLTLDQRTLYYQCDLVENLCLSVWDDIVTAVQWETGVIVSQYTVCMTFTNTHILSPGGTLV